MEIEKYLKESLKTESIDFEKIRNRIPDGIFGTVRIFCDMYRGSNMMDCYKKYIFYGKEKRLDFAKYETETFEKDIRGSKHFVQNNISNISEKEIRLLHACMGIITETFELSKPIIKSIIFKEEIDYINIKEELGDIFWYIAVIVDILGKCSCKTSEEALKNILSKNVDKLQKVRYRKGFSEHSANNRDLDLEMKILKK